MVALAALPGSPPQVEAWLGLLEKGVSAAGGPVECLKPQAAEHSRQVSGTGVGQIRLVAQTAAVGESDTQNSRGLRLHMALQMTESLCFQQVPSCNSSKECRGQRALDILVAAKVLSLPLVEKRRSANSQDADVRPSLLWHSSGRYSQTCYRHSSSNSSTSCPTSAVPGLPAVAVGVDAFFKRLGDSLLQLFVSRTGSIVSPLSSLAARASRV